MPAQRASNQILLKQNVRPIVNRQTEATAEDFKEIGDVINNHADLLDILTPNNSPNPFFGIHETLNILNAAFPIGEDGGYAIIDAGDGSPSRLAYWNSNTQLWEVQVTTATQTENVIQNGDNVSNVVVFNDAGHEIMMVSGTFISGDPTRFEDYSKNSIWRRLS